MMTRENKFKPAASLNDLKKISEAKNIARNIRTVKRAKQLNNQTDEFIVLDVVFDPKSESMGLPFVLEHATVNTGNKVTWNGKQFDEKKDIYEPCSKAIGESCPVCDGRVSKQFGSGEKYNNPQVVTYLSVIHLNPKKKDGSPVTNKEGVPYKGIKQLMPLKAGDKSNMSAIMDVLQEAYWQEVKGKPVKSIYGVKLLLKRGSDNMSPTIGEPIRYPATGDGLGSKFKRVPKQWLIDNFGHEAKTDKDGNIYAEANSYIEPYDYAKLFAVKTEKEVCEKYGISYNAPVGSGDNKGFYSDDYEVGDVGSEDDDVPFDVEPATTQNKKSDKSFDDDDFDFDDDIPF